MHKNLLFLELVDQRLVVQCLFTFLDGASRKVKPAFPTPVLAQNPYMVQTFGHIRR